MRSRLKPILIVLLALLVCGASSQATVCNLSCGLEGTCHMAAASQQPAMQVASPGRCSSAMQMVPESYKGAHASGLSASGCEHSFFPAIESSSAWKVHVAAAKWSFYQDVSTVGETVETADLPDKLPPRRLASADRLLIHFRV